MSSEKSSKRAKVSSENCDDRRENLESSEESKEFKEFKSSEVGIANLSGPLLQDISQFLSGKEYYNWTRACRKTLMTASTTPTELAGNCNYNYSNSTTVDFVEVGKSTIMDHYGKFLLAADKISNSNNVGKTSASASANSSAGVVLSFADQRILAENKSVMKLRPRHLATTRKEINDFAKEVAEMRSSLETLTVYWTSYRTTNNSCTDSSSLPASIQLNKFSRLTKVQLSVCPGHNTNNGGNNNNIGSILQLPSSLTHLEIAQACEVCLDNVCPFHFATIDAFCEPTETTTTTRSSNNTLVSLGNAAASCCSLRQFVNLQFLSLRLAHYETYNPTQNLPMPSNLSNSYCPVPSYPSLTHFPKLTQLKLTILPHLSSHRATMQQLVQLENLNHLNLDWRDLAPITDADESNKCLSVRRCRCSCTRYKTETEVSKLGYCDCEFGIVNSRNNIECLNVLPRLTKLRSLSMAIGGNSCKPEVSAQIMEKLRLVTQLTSLDFDNSFNFDWPSFNNHLLRTPITLTNLVRLRLSDDSRRYNNSVELRKLNSRMLGADEKFSLQLQQLPLILPALNHLTALTTFAPMSLEIPPDLPKLQCLDLGQSANSASSKSLNLFLGEEGYGRDGVQNNTTIWLKKYAKTLTSLVLPRNAMRYYYREFAKEELLDAICSMPVLREIIVPVGIGKTLDDSCNCYLQEIKSRRPDIQISHNLSRLFE